MIAFSRGSLLGLLLAFICLSSVFSGPLFAQDAASEATDIQSLLKQIQSGKVDEQIEAVVRLSALGPYAQPAIKPLVELLKTDNQGLRYECIVALGHIGPMAQDSAGSLTEFLSSDSELLQSAALESLRRIGTSSPEAQMQIRRLRESGNVALAISSIRCLVVLAGSDDKLVQSSITPLVKALGDARPHVRNEAAVTLVEIGPTVVPAVASALSGNDAHVPLKACEILGQFGVDSAPTVPALLKHLKDDDELLVRAATIALGKIHAQPDTVLPALTALLEKKSVAVRITAVRAIADFGSAAVGSAPLMLNLLSDDNTMLRASAADALGQIGDTRSEVIDALVKALSDGQAQVTLKAADALSNIGAPAVPALMQKLSDKSYRRLVVEVLGEIGPGAEAAVPELVAMLSDVGDDLELQREVFIALASMGPKANGATPAMMKILQDPMAVESRAGAAYVLARIGEKDALPVLRKLVREARDEKILRSCSWALVTLDPQNEENVKVALPHLLQATSADLSFVRREALAAFGTLGPAAISVQPTVLELAASDPDGLVRIEALHTLARIQAPAEDVLPVAISSLQNADPDVRNAARYLLGTLGEKAQSTAPALRESLRNGNELEKLLSAWALVNVQPSRENAQVAVPFLLTALKHPNPQVRAEVATTLGKIAAGSEQIRSALEAVENDEDPLVKKAVQKALAPGAAGR